MKPVIDRVEKLLRLASPKSGTTEHERASAALEVVKLIEENDLIVRERKAEPAPRRRKRERETSQGAWSGDRAHQTEREPFYAHVHTPQHGTKPPGNWVQSVAMHDGVCADEECAAPIHAGEPVWSRMHGYGSQYLHFHGPCGW